MKTTILKNKYNKYLLLVLILIIIILIRFPITNHSYGQDSFYIYTLANSIVDSGEANWILHPLSHWKMLPLSENSGMPYLLALLNLITGIDMEIIIYLLCLFFGIFAFFSMYLLSSLFFKSEIYRIISGLLFSISPLIIKFTNWTISPRGLFLVFLPLFIYCMFKIKEDRKYLVLSIIMLLFLSLIHKLYLLILLTVASYLFATFLCKLNLNKDKLIKVFILLSIIGFLIQSFVFKHSWVFRYVPYKEKIYYYWYGLFYTIFARFGPLLFLFFIALIFFYFKKNNRFQEVFLIIHVFLISLFLSHTMYFFQYSTFLIILLSVYTIDFIIELNNRFKIIDSKHIVTIILFSVILFSLLTLNVRLGNEDNYMQDSLEKSANFIINEVDSKENIEIGYEANLLSSQVSNIVKGSNNYLTKPSSVEYFEYSLNTGDSMSDIASFLSFIRNPFIFTEFDSPYIDYKYSYNTQEDEPKIYSNDKYSISYDSPTNN